MNMMNWSCPSAALILVRSITSRVPRIRGLGLLIAPVARFFRTRAREDVEVSVFGRIMLLDPADAIGNALLFAPQWYDPRERRFIAKIVKPGDYVIDVGANIGAYSLIFAAAVGPGGRITCIEAEPRNAQRLRHNLARNRITWADAVQCGVSNKRETLPLHLNNDGNAGAHSFLQQVSKSDATQTLECRPLYELMERKRPRLIKLDIEGFEWRVLCGFFADAPQDLWPEYILLEDDARHRENDAVALLHEQGYRVVHRFDSNVFLRFERG